MQTTNVRVEYESGGNYYEGEIKADGGAKIPHGCGVFTWMNGDAHEGTFVDGKFREGVLRFPDGSSVKYSDWVRRESFDTVGFKLYDVEVADGLANVNGKGEKFYVNGDVYRGEFVNGWPHGQGTLNYPNGEVCEGTFIREPNDQCDKAEADGEYLLSGCFDDCKLDGIGSFTHADGIVCEGPFVRGLANGLFII